MNRGALNLLANYGSDSSEDETPSLNVSVKRTHKENDNETNQQQKRKLPLPTLILEDNQPPDVHIDDPSLHEGRIRSFKHERGNWATYFYVPYKPSSGVQALVQLITSYLPKNDLKPVDNCHISVTKTVIVRHHWIEPLVTSVKQNLLGFHSFLINFGGLKAYCNEEKTRTFVGLTVEQGGHDSLVKMAGKMDFVLGEFNLPQFYPEPSFHVSLCWCIGDFLEEVKEVLEELEAQIEEIKCKFSEENWFFVCDRVECKTGNKLFTFNFD